MRTTLGPLLFAALLLVGCEDGKPTTPPPEEKPAQAAPSEASPTQASPSEATPPSGAPRLHGATGVGDTTPVPEREPPKSSSAPPTASDWGRKSDTDAGAASDAGSPQRRLDDVEEGTRPGQRGPRAGEGKGPIHP